MARFIINKGVLENVFTMDEEITIPEEVNKIDNFSFDVCSNLKRVIIDHRVNAKKISIDYNEFFLPSGITYVINGFSISWPSEEDAWFEEKLFNSAMSGQITAVLLQLARRRETKDPIYLHLCRQGQEDCLEYVKKSIMRFAKDAIDRDCIAELKEFDSYGFISKSNAGKLAEYALEKEKKNSGTVVCLLEIMDRTTGFKLEQLDKFLEMAQENVEITAWLLECKNKHFTVDEIDKIETEKMEKKLGLKERTLAEWKKIFSLDDDGSGGLIIYGYKGEETQIIIPDVIAKKKVTAIEAYAFSPEKERLTKIIKDIRGKITSVFVPDTVTSIGYCAFYCCSSLTSITIPDTVTSIGYAAFESCSSLTSITIPNSVTSIGESAFGGTKWLDNYPDDFVIVNGILIRYKGKEKNVIIPDSVTSIGRGAFMNCSSLTSIAIPDSVTSIEGGAFYECSSLTSITLPDTVKSIEWNAFYGCISLTSITIPDSVTSIGKYAFSHCSSLTSITIPDSVTSIGDYAFYECSSLKSITIPESVTSIGDSAFLFCSSLKSITIPESVTSIGDRVFYGCKKLTSITIPDTVTSIEWNAFYGCSSLTSITIPESVTSIGDHAFSNCSSLTSITIPDSVTSIGEDAFDKSSHLTINAPANSCAIKYAEKHRMSYSVI